MLRPEGLPYAAAIGGGFILMDDNATPHRARVALDFLNTEEIESMDWPPKSPDLNPIEPLWGVPGGEYHSNRYRTLSTA